MTALALFLTGWAALGCIVNIPAWLFHLAEPGSLRAECARLAIVLQALGLAAFLITTTSAIWQTGTLAPIILINISVAASWVVIWAGLIGLAGALFVWTSQLPKNPPVMGMKWPWLIYLVGTFVWGIAVALRSAGAI